MNGSVKKMVDPTSIYFSAGIYNQSSMSNSYSSVRSKIWINLFLLFVLSTLFSIVLAADVGGYAGSFLRVGTTARSIAMGCGMTADLNRGFAAYHNPASVAFLDKRYISVFHHFLPLDRYLVSTTFATPLPPTGGVGIALVSAGVDEIDGRDQTGHDIGTFSAAEYAAYFSFANELVKGVSVGVNVKVLYQSFPVDGGTNASGTGVDVGIIIRKIKNIDIGFMYQDVNTRFAWKSAGEDAGHAGGYEDYFPRQLRIGINYHPELIRVVGDYTFVLGDETVYDHRVRFGCEYFVYPNVALRAGIDHFSPTLGAGLKYSLLKRNDAYVDYAFRLGQRGEGFSHIFTYIFTF